MSLSLPANDGFELCARCSDDGWVEIFDDDGFPMGGQDCPYLNAPWHRTFNASGLLRQEFGGTGA